MIRKSKIRKIWFVRILSVHLWKNNTIMTTIRKEKARFDTRLPQEQKNFFERAAIVGGYRNLTDFVIMTVQEKAKEIIEKRDQIIASQRDSTIFFEAITKPAKPNKALISAAKEYKSLTSK